MFPSILPIAVQFFPLQMKRDLCYNEGYTKIHRKEGQAHDLCAACLLYTSKMVGQRRSMLAYLQKKDINRYRALIAKLGIRK